MVEIKRAAYVMALCILPIRARTVFESYLLSTQDASLRLRLCESRPGVPVRRQEVSCFPPP